MSYKKLLLSTACILALSACGGGGGDGDSGASSPDTPVKPDTGSVKTHDYYSLDRKDKGTVQINHAAASGVLALNGEDIGWSVTNDALAITGYAHLSTYEVLDSDVGLILCPGTANTDAKHVVVPNSATTYASTEQALEDLKGKVLNEYTDCQASPKDGFPVLTFNSDGTLHVAERGGGDTNLTKEQVASLFSSSGFSPAGENSTSYGTIYKLNGAPVLVINSIVQPNSSGDTSYISVAVPVAAR